MKTPSLLALPALALLAAACGGCMSTADSNTQRVAGGAVTRFRQVDADNDGKVTFAEFDAGFAGTIFSQYNRDAGGSVTLAEWDAIERANQDKAKSSFRLLDRNRDGKLTNDELIKGKRRNTVVRRVFTRIDKNGDGSLTEQEARSFGIERASDRDPANHP